jgi:alkylation response protein AidB-like acyl-CoA dehydrogenase
VTASGSFGAVDAARHAAVTRPWMRDATNDQRAFVAALDELCAREITDERLRQLDVDRRYPTEIMRSLADAGWASMPVPEEHGGTGGSAVDVALVHRTIASYGLAPAQAYFSLWTLGADAIGRLGSKAQRDAWLPRIAAGDANVAFAMTEPEAGSDAAALRAQAVLEGERLVVSGQKVFITGAAVADTIITAVRTGRRTDASRGISLVMIDPRSPGVAIRKIDKIGLRAIDLCEVFLTDVAVTRDSVLGPLHGGWEALRQGLALERTLLAAICTGATGQILALCLDHAQQRRAFGRAIGGFQMVGAALTQLRVALDASSLLVDRAAAAIDAGAPDAAVLASIAKLHAAEAYVTATRVGTQVFGGYGFTEEYPVGRHYRDAKFMEIGGGTSEIQTMIVARSMGLS